MLAEAQREQHRLAALERYDIIDTPAEESFDRITRLVKRIFGVSMATITFIDGHRQWFKSHIGMPCRETSRAPAFCNVAIREAAPLVVEDALNDERFSENPFVLGSPYIRFYAGVPLRAPDGQAIGTLCAMDQIPRRFDAADLATLSDLAGIVVSELELRTLAATDALTGALSRRAFMDEGGRAFDLARRHGHALSCVMFDLDHFKNINDQCGHAIGDRVLTECIAICRARIRKSDLLGRVGGEEFVVLLPHAGPADAMDVAEKMRQGVAGLRIAAEACTVSVSASFGVATSNRSMVDLETLLKSADMALYTAKNDGRNQCAAWSPTEIVPPNLRRRVFKAGKISFNLGRSVIDCTVKAVADNGAGLAVVSSAGIPAQFKLLIEADDFSRACRILTKDEKHIEVAFD
jgi:diguanylate cyclase (GGDEF)-like protein